MQRHQTYPMQYTSTTPAPTKYSASQNTSSAFSASANPNEDWTKISDLAERRRIQNRIAQRNYRKKIKRRLEDLEKRASSSSPERAHAELAPSHQRTTDASKRRRSKTDSHSQNRQRLPEVVNPPPFAHDIKPEFSPEQFGRELSVSPPPAFGQSYSLPDPNAHATYYQPSNVHALPASYPEYSAPQYYLPPLPSTLPNVPSYEPSKPNVGYYEGEEMFSHFSSGTYSPFELPMQQSYPDSNVHTPPLSHSHSFDHSRDGSPSIAFPGTPVSIPDSPKMMFR